MQRSFVVVLSALLLGTACEPARRELPHLDRGPGPDAQRDPLGAALHQDVVRRGGMMEEVGTATRGALNPDGTAETSLILQAGYCYGVIARVTPEAGELRLRIVDSNGDPRQLDRESGAGASIGFDEALCPEPTTEYRLELRAQHAGGYAFRLFRMAAI